MDQRNIFSDDHGVADSVGDYDISARASFGNRGAGVGGILRRQMSEHSVQSDVNPMDIDSMGDGGSDQESDQSVDIIEEETHPQIDPFTSAAETMEERVIATLDNFKLLQVSNSDELKEQLRPVLEIAAHVGPATARNHHQFHPTENVDDAVTDIYHRINVSLILPSLLEVAQSDIMSAKRGAALAFFQHLYKECCQPGSYLDKTIGPSSGPTGPGGTQPVAGPGAPGQATVVKAKYSAMARIQMSNRSKVKATREAELLSYWMEASIGCIVAGSFTNADKDEAVGSRGVLSATAAIRPTLRSIGGSIAAADDAGAMDLYRPLMKMLDGVLNRLFLSNLAGAGGESGGHDRGAVISACIKFLETVVLCFSNRGPRDAAGGRRRSFNTDDVALEDLPVGHPVITRMNLESVAEFAFTVLRGFVKVGGQIKIDTSLLPAGSALFGAMLASAEVNSTNPASQLVAILKPAALAFLEVEPTIDANVKEKSSEDVRQNVDNDFLLSQKSFALAINALSITAINRPACFKAAALALCCRTMDPPKQAQTAPAGGLTKAGAMAISSQLKASCLTLLRNPLSVTVGGWEALQEALNFAKMEKQAEKALLAANQQAALKTAGRAARNRAAMFYEWDKTEADRQSKRQRETDDALAQMRAAKRERGLGHGIQLPSSMVEACELVLLNLQHLPEGRPATVATKSIKLRKRRVTLDFLMDAIITNGASLSYDESRWYDRDGGAAWEVSIGEEIIDGRQAISVILDSKTLDTFTNGTKYEKSNPQKGENQKLKKQCDSAVCSAFERVIAATTSTSTECSDLASTIAARLAWTLKGVKLSHKGELLDSAKFVTESAVLFKEAASETPNACKKEGEIQGNSIIKQYNLVTSCLALGFTRYSETSTLDPESGYHQETSRGAAEFKLINRILFEGYLQSEQNHELKESMIYDDSLNLFASSVAHACEQAKQKPNDNGRRQIATQAALRLSEEVHGIPSVPYASLVLASSMCDIEAITKVASDSARKGSHHSLASSAKAHAAKVAAEKRATTALLMLRDVAYRYSKIEVRKNAVDCAVGIASGRLRATSSVQDKALKLVMNVLFSKSTALANIVVSSATDDLERSTNFAIECYDAVNAANIAASVEEAPQTTGKSGLQPLSEVEKSVMEKVRKPAVLFMALCIRRPDMMKALLANTSRKGADVLAKAVKLNMPKLAKAAATKYGAATIALRVAEMATDEETSMLVAFLDNLSSSVDTSTANEDLIHACSQIQEQKMDSNGTKDPRYIIPVVASMKRAILVKKLPEFVGASDLVFKAALRRMSERVGRQALIFREEHDKDTDTLSGMTLCEQLVYLHWVDFTTIGLPQKRYLESIRLCLDDSDMFTDRVIMSALDYVSTKFFTTDLGLPLAYMRTIILTCTKHESLHPWICQVLLPRLVEGKVYQDRRQWEGWMRCAKMLEQAGNSGASSIDAIKSLPEEQLQMYKARYPSRHL